MNLAELPEVTFTGQVRASDEWWKDVLQRALEAPPVRTVTVTTRRSLRTMLFSRPWHPLCRWLKVEGRAEIRGFTGTSLTLRPVAKFTRTYHVRRPE